MPSKRDLLREKGYRQLQKKKKKELTKNKAINQQSEEIPKRKQGNTANFLIGIGYITIGTIGAVLAIASGLTILGLAFAIIMNIFGWKRMSKISSST